MTNYVATWPRIPKQGHNKPKLPKTSFLGFLGTPWDPWDPWGPNPWTATNKKLLDSPSDPDVLLQKEGSRPRAPASAPKALMPGGWGRQSPPLPVKSYYAHPKGPGAQGP